MGSRDLVLAGMLAALVLLATMIKLSPTPTAYFNFGEAVIYATALLFGRRVGFLAAAVGSALADLIGGYFLWAPFSFFIKGIEALIVAALSRRHGSRRQLPAVAAGALWMMFGYGSSTALLYGAAAVPLELTIDLLQTSVGAVLALLAVFVLRRAYPEIARFRQDTGV